MPVQWFPSSAPSNWASSSNLILPSANLSNEAMTLQFYYKNMINIFYKKCIKFQIKNADPAVQSFILRLKNNRMCVSKSWWKYIPTIVSFIPYFRLLVFCILVTFDLSFASTETKYIKPKTKTQNNIVIFGFFHKKIILIFWLFLK